MKDLSPDQKACVMAVKADFGAFVQYAFSKLYDTQDFEPNWHIDAIINALERNLSGETPRLIINLPPRRLKSFIVSICWPAFLLTRDPSLKIFVVSYTDELAKTIAHTFRKLVESDWYRWIFDNVVMDKMTEHEAITTKQGFRVALSVHGSITGRGADLIIVDDPCRPEEVSSDAMRLKVNEWFKSTLLSRLEDKARSGLIIVMQRLHVNDLVGFAEETGNFHKLSLPAIAERDEVIELGHGRTHLRRAGEALQPERESVKVLEELKRQLGPFLFAAQYQQSPCTEDGQLFKRKHFILVDEMPALDRHGALFLTVDSAMSRTPTADYTAIVAAYIRDRRLYVLRVDRGRYGFEELKNRTRMLINQLAKNGGRVHVVVEGSSSGIWLAQDLVDRRDERVNLFSFKPRTDKFDRAARVLNMFDAGVFVCNVKDQNTWVEPFINEFMNFPNGANDDQVDALVQLFSWNQARVLLLDYGNSSFMC